MVKVLLKKKRDKKWIKDMVNIKEIAWIVNSMILQVKCNRVNHKGMKVYLWKDKSIRFVSLSFVINYRDKYYI